MLKRSMLLLYFWPLVLNLFAQNGGTNIVQEQLIEVEALLDAARYREADSLLLSLKPDIQAGDDPGLKAETYRLQGYLALEQGLYEKAFEAFREAVAFTGSTFSTQDPVVGQAFNDLGHYYFSTGQLDSAHHYHERSLAIRLAHFGDTQPEVADSYNNLGNVYQSAGRSAEALEYYEKALAIRRRHQADNPAEMASALNNLGNAYLSLGQLARAAQAFRQTLDIRIDLLGPDHPRYGRSLQNLGNAFYQWGALDSARFYYELALENARLNYDSTHPQLANLYENLGNCALRKNQLDLAEQEHRQALEIREKLSNSDPVAPATSYLHLGDIHRKKGDYLEAMRLTEKGWIILSEYLQEGDPYLADAWEKLGLCHQTLGHFRESRDALLTALETRWKFYGPTHPLIAGTYTNLGNLFWQQSDLSTAIYYYNSAMEIWQQYGNQFRFELAEALSNIGNSHLKNEAWPEALAAYQRALQQLPPEEMRLRATVWQQIGVVYDGLDQYDRALDAYANALQLFDRSREDQQNEILFTLNARASTLLHIYEANQNLDTLYLATAAFEESLALLDDRNLNLLHTESRQKAIALHYDLFEGAIACQLARWELEKDSTYLWQAFRWSEASKGLKLRERWQDDPGNQTSPLARALRTNDAAATALHQQLQPNRGLLAFFAGPKKLFWFFLQDGRLNAGRIDEMPVIDRLISEMGQSLTQYPIAGSEQQVLLDSFYRATSRELYRRIWQPLEKQFEGLLQLTIVPDGSLAYLPFAVLLTEEVKTPMRFKTYPYLLQKYQISYGYSVTLLARALEQTAPKNREKCLAIAPVFDGYDPPLAALDYNSVEVKELVRTIGATPLLAGEATRENFLATADHYRILHLATHGVANIERSEYSYLAFSLSDKDRDGRLYVNDLYNLDLPAELVVMSACESGTGLFQAGEGSISLGRGFVAAGARSLIATLWSVNDAKTASFMQAFYRELKRGATKDEAIRKVQQAYLEESGSADAHPFFWAAFLPIGDMEPIAISNGLSAWAISGIILAVLGIFLLLKTPLLKNLSK